VNLGYKVDILTYPIGRDVNIEGINIIRVKKFLNDPPYGAKMSLIRLLTDCKLLVLSLKLAIQKKNEYSFIFAKTPIGGLIGTQVKRILKVPLLIDLTEPLTSLTKKYTSHNLLSGKFSAILNLIFSSRLVLKILRILELYLYKNVDTIFANWDLSAELIKKDINPKTRVEVLYSAKLFKDRKNSDELAPDSHKLIEQKTKNKKIVFYAGGFERYQGVDLCIKAFAEANIDDSLFVIAGSYDEYHRKLPKQLNIEDKVIFLGRVKHEELDYFYSLANLLVTAHDLPNCCGASSKIIEYMMKNKPVLAVNNPQNAQIASDREVYLVNRTVEDFAKAIKEIFKNYTDALLKAQTAHDYALKKFGNEEFTNKILSSILSLSR